MDRFLFVFVVALVPAHGPVPTEPPGSATLKKLPTASAGPDRYRVDPYLKAAAELQALGKDKAVKILQAAAEGPEAPDEAIFILCRMLFTAKPEGEFRRAATGLSLCLGGTGSPDWAREPIEIVNGIPFLIVNGSMLGGKAETGKGYLAYCLKECDWGTEEFKPRTGPEKQKALKVLLASKKWKQPLRDAEKEFLASQIE